jgi:hypothetical protein
MATYQRFTRARKETVAANYGTHELEYLIPDNTELHIHELFLSASKIIIAELQYSDDGGTTWKNPWDTSSEHLIWIVIGAGIPVHGSPQGTWFTGDGVNTKLRIRITNTEANDATVFYLIKGLERV